MQIGEVMYHITLDIPEKVLCDSGKPNAIDNIVWNRKALCIERTVYNEITIPKVVFKEK